MIQVHPLLCWVVGAATLLALRAAIAGAQRIVDHARYVQAPEEPMLDPKTLWRIRPDVNVVPVPPPPFSWICRDCRHAAH
jgi:hypothetical protein